jgi:hypothetical protein
MSVVRFSEYLLQMTDDGHEPYHCAAARGSQAALATASRGRPDGLLRFKASTVPGELCLRR